GVDALGEPDFIHVAAEGGRVQGIPQAGEGINPGVTIVSAIGGAVHIEPAGHFFTLKLEFVSAHIDDGRALTRRIVLTWVAVQVSGQASGQGIVVANVDGRRTGSQAQIPGCSRRILGIDWHHEQWVSINVVAVVDYAATIIVGNTTILAQAALYQAVGNGGHGASAVVVHDIAYMAGAVIPEDDVGQRGAGFAIRAKVVHGPACVPCLVTAEGDVGQRGAAVSVKHGPAAVCPVASEDDVGQRGAAPIADHGPAAEAHRVAAKGDVGQRGTALAAIMASVVHGPAAVVCPVTTEG